MLSAAVRPAQPRQMPAQLAVDQPSHAQRPIPILAGACRDVLGVHPNPLGHMRLDGAGVGVRELARLGADAHRSPLLCASVLSHGRLSGGEASSQSCMRRQSEG